MEKCKTSLLYGLLLLSLSFLPLQGVRADEVTVADANGNELRYRFDGADGPATFFAVKKYAEDEAKAGHIVIADEVTDGNGNSHEVKYVSGGVSYRSEIVSIVFGKNIVATGGPEGNESDAFYNCPRLESVTLNEKLEILGRYTFQRCPKLSSIDLSQAPGLKTIRYRCFEATPLKSILIPSSVELIEDGIIDNNDSLRSVTFLAPAVPNYFCRYHKNLASIAIGENCKRIGNYGFSNNYGLRSVSIDSGVSGLTIGEYAFAESDALPGITLPEGVTTIERAAFRSCDSLRVFSFAPESKIHFIPTDCFAYCLSLESLTLPEAVDTVDNSAFYDCESLRTLTFGTKLKTIIDTWYTFAYCGKLESIYLPGETYPFTRRPELNTSVLFYVNQSLADEYRTNDFTKDFRIVAIGQPMELDLTTTDGGQLQDKVEAVADPLNVMRLSVSGPINGTDIDFLHSSLPNLEVLDLGRARIVSGGDSYHQWDANANGTTTRNEWYGPWNTEDDVVGYAMFYNMPSLRSLTIPASTKKIGDYAFAQDRNRNFRLASINIPDGVTEIGRYAFYYTGITEATVPSGVTRLEECTFHHCERLQKASLPDGITFIGSSAFSEDYELADVNIPTSVETIESYAFYNNYKRTTPIVLPPSLRIIGYRAFMYNRIVKEITFSEGLETIRNYAFSNCNAVESLSLPASVATIENNAFEGCDSITHFKFPPLIRDVADGVLYHCDKLRQVVLADSTYIIRGSAFSECPSLADINLNQEALRTIGSYAFYNTGLVNVTLPNGITNIEWNVFQNCQQLESINVPTGIDYVPYDYCHDCPKLSNVTMHDGIRTIRHRAFRGCHSLKNIDLNDEIASIEYDAFCDCDSLALEKLPAALTFIGGSSFRNTKAITGVITIPEGVKTIEGEAFNSSGITGVVLPEGITTWGTGLFYGCKQLTSVHLPQDITRITNYMFQQCSALETIDIPDGLKQVGYCGFDHSGLVAITLPDSLEVIEDYAFRYTQLRTFTIPDGLTGDPGSYTWEDCKHLKSMYLGRNQDYTRLSSFTCLNRCDSLELLRIYAGVPPKCDTWYMGYRSHCVLEVPEDQVEAYREANGWKEFMEIRPFFMGDVLNALDYAVLCKMYRDLDGANWNTPWDIANDHHSSGKWPGVTTVGAADNTYYITAIELPSQGLCGELPDSLFLLTRLETLNLSNNKISGDLGTLFDNIGANASERLNAAAATVGAVASYAPLTTVNMEGNRLTGDVYPFASALPTLTHLNLGYNRLTDVSQPIPNTTLNTDYQRLMLGYQFIDITTKKTVEDADVPVADLTPGQPVEDAFTSLFKYRHNYQDFGLTPSSLARLYWRNGWSQDTELAMNGESLWDAHTYYVLHAPKDTIVAYTCNDPWWSPRTAFFRLTWTDGDVNADQEVDVADLQSVVYYALNDGKPSEQIFNYTTADATADNRIDVRDIVASVDYVLGYTSEATAPTIAAAAFKRSEAFAPNIASYAPNLIAISGNAITMSNADDVAAIQLTISGCSSRQLRVSDELRGRFSIALRDIDGGVRLVAYSTSGNILTAGDHSLVEALPAGSFVAEARLANGEARRLGVTIAGEATGVGASLMNSEIVNSEVFDLQGRPVGEWQSLPSGIYVIKVNGRQYKVKK